MRVTTRSRLRRLGAAAVATAIALAGVAGPAYADEPASAPSVTATASPTPAEPSTASTAPTASPTPTAEPTPTPTAASESSPAAAPDAAAATADLSVTIRGTTVAAGSTGKHVEVRVRNDGPATVRHGVVELTFTPGTAPDAVELGEAPCNKPAPNVYRCGVGAILASGQTGRVRVWYQPLPGAAPTTDAGSLRAVASSPVTESDPADNTATATFAIAGSGPDLALNMRDETYVVPGQVNLLAGGIVNRGDTPSGPFVLDITLPRRVTVPAEAVAELGCDVAADRRSLRCAGPAVEPYRDEEHALYFEVPITLPRDAGLARTFTGGTAVLSEAAAGGASRSFAAGKPARIFRTAASAPAADVDASDNRDAFAVRTTDEVADLVVEASPARAATGRTVLVPFRVRNDGPDKVGSATVLITPPTGTKVVWPQPASIENEWCDLLETGEIECRMYLGVGAAKEFNLHLRIAGSTVGDDGRITASAYNQWDPRLGNSTARIVIPDADDLTQGRLPVTGTALGVILTGGLLMLAGGAALVLGARRRRTA
jgi:hypothetical protein